MIVSLTGSIMTREQIIHNMCLTFRHDYGMIISEDEAMYSLSAGMTQRQREALYQQMAQIFDNDIAPHMEFKGNKTSTIDEDSPPGSWENALKYSENIKVIDDDV